MKSTLLSFNKILGAGIVLMLSACASKNPLIDNANSDLARAAKQEAAQSISQANNQANNPPFTPSPTATVNAVSNNSHLKQVQANRFLSLITPYRVDVQQGNFISREMVNQLNVGMPQEEVLALLGTPLLRDVLHQDRWDYVFRYQKGDGTLTSNLLTLFFTDKHLSKIEGEQFPSEQEYIARILDSKKIEANKTSE